MATSRSLFPDSFNKNWWDAWDSPSTSLWDPPPTSLWDQYFGMGLFNGNLFPPVRYEAYLLRQRTRDAIKSSSDSPEENGEGNFKVMLNVTHFKPDEVDVKLVDNYVVIHGRHEEKSDEHGFIQREFTRRYLLPEGIEAQTVKLSMSPIGILTIEAEKKAIELTPSNERVIPVSMSYGNTED